MYKSSLWKPLSLSGSVHTKLIQGLPRIDAKMAEALYFDWSIPLHRVSRFGEYYLDVHGVDYIGRTLSK